MQRGIVVFLIIIVFLGGAIYLQYNSYSAKINSLQSQISGLQNQINDLNSILNLQETQSILSEYTVNHGPSTFTNIANFTTSHAGYLKVSMTSDASNAMVEVTYSFKGQEFHHRHTLGHSGSVLIPILPASIRVWLGNTNSIQGVTHTITATYYY